MWPGATARPGRCATAAWTSYAAFPVRDGDRVIGAFLCYFSKSDEPLTTADDRTIEAVGRIVSIAYANVRMSEGLDEAAEHERRLTAELRALQELTLLGATTDDLARLAQETIEAVVVSHRRSRRRLHPGRSRRPRRWIRSSGSDSRAAAGWL